MSIRWANFDSMELYGSNGIVKKDMDFQVDSLGVDFYGLTAPFKGEELANPLGSSYPMSKGEITNLTEFGEKYLRKL